MLTRPGIAVSSTPVAVNHATADVGIFLMIGALRQAYVPLAALRAGISPFFFFFPFVLYKSENEIDNYRPMARKNYAGP